MAVTDNGAGLCFEELFWVPEIHSRVWSWTKAKFQAKSRIVQIMRPAERWNRI